MLPLTFLLAFAAIPAGLWDATLTVDGRPVAFRIEFKGGTNDLKAAILDGDRPIWSTSGSFANNALSLRWDYFDSTLTASLQDNRLTGAYSRRTRAGLITRPFTASPFQAPKAPAEDPKDVSGVWRFQTDAAKGARVMDGRFRQSGSQVTGTIQRVDGDFGTLTGSINGSRFVLTHFDGIRATYLEGVLTSEGTLKGRLDGSTNFTAARFNEAARLGIPDPPDPARYVAVKNPTAPLTFRFQDLDGNWVSSDDTRFRGKAMIVTIMGSWCPNCHDEADFLQRLYKQYQPQGFEVVALGFEYTGEVDRDRGQLRAFTRRHGLTYTTLLAGTTEDGEVLKKLPQLANFAGYPATLYLDRAHRVRSVHAGFAGPANPEEHQRLTAEIQSLVKTLIVEN